MQSSLASLTSSQLRRAAALQEKIESLQAELSRITGGAVKKTAGRPAKKKRTMSPEARAKIAAAQRRRWAKQKAAAK